jgi:hypothetical protein
MTSEPFYTVNLKISINGIEIRSEGIQPPRVDHPPAPPPQR